MIDTKFSQDELILLFAEDDEEDSPWMAMNDPQFDAASALYTVLRSYTHRHDLGWYVASMLPILYPKPGLSFKKGKLSPDLYVAFVPERPRKSFDIVAEGQFPPFVLEVVSEDSIGRDLEEKLELYRVLGAREYVLFAPTADLKLPSLQGYRRDREGQFTEWQVDDHGRLFSDVLGLRLVVQERPSSRLLRAEDVHGTLLPTLEEAEAARRRAEAEVERLRAELERRNRP